MRGIITETEKIRKNGSSFALLFCYGAVSEQRISRHCLSMKMENELFEKKTALNGLLS